MSHKYAALHNTAANYTSNSNRPSKNLDGMPLLNESWYCIWMHTGRPTAE